MYNLLVVDDKDVFFRTITRMPYFKNNPDKFQIKYHAKNGIEALQCLENGDVDIVLTDIRMPLMNGIELLKGINEKNLCKCTILLSEYADFSYAKEGIINGAFDYIVKPVDDKILKGTFDRAYSYLQDLSSDGNFLFSSIDRLAECIMSGGDTVFLSILQTIIDSIKQNSKSLSDMLLTTNKSLQRLQKQITIQYSYITNYLPLNRICSYDGFIHDENECITLFHTKILYLRNRLKKFHVASTHPLIQNIWSYTIHNIETPCTLQTVAELFYVNRNYLSTLFKKETGIYYKNFVIDLKIDRAKMLLSYTDLKISDIAEKLHFSDAEYFSKLFKKQTGFIPSDFCWDKYLRNKKITG